MRGLFEFKEKCTVTKKRIIRSFRAGRIISLERDFIMKSKKV